MNTMVFAAVALLLQVHSCLTAPTASGGVAVMHAVGDGNLSSKFNLTGDPLIDCPIIARRGIASDACPREPSTHLPYVNLADSAAIESEIKRSIPSALDDSDGDLDPAFKLPEVHIPIPVWDENPVASSSKRDPVSTIAEDCVMSAFDRRDLEAVRRCLRLPMMGHGPVVLPGDGDGNPSSTIPIQSKVNNGTNTTSTVNSTKNAPTKLPHFSPLLAQQDPKIGEAVSQTLPRALNLTQLEPVRPNFGNECPIMDRRGNIKRMVCPYPFRMGTTVIGQSSPFMGDEEASGSAVNGAVVKRNPIVGGPFNFTRDGWIDCPAIGRRDGVVYRRCATTCPLCEGVIKPVDLTTVMDKRHVLLPGESPDPQCTGPFCVHLVDERSVKTTHDKYGKVTHAHQPASPDKPDGKHRH